MRIDEYPNIDELLYKKIINQVPIIDEYANQEINKVLEEIRAEIRHFMFEVNPSSSESDYACNYILDVINKKMRKESESKLNMELNNKYQFQLNEGGAEWK